MPTALSTLSSGLVRAGRGIIDRMSRDALPWTTSPAIPPVADYGSASPWDIRDQMLDGSIYLPAKRDGTGGSLKTIIRQLGKPCDNAPPIIGYYNPVPAIVGCYANALGGRLGSDLNLVKHGGEPLEDAVQDAYARLWRMSNLDTRLDEFTRLTANQGTAGIRIVGTGRGADARIRLVFEHPSWIVDAEEDDRGNLRWVYLRYTAYQSAGPGETYEPVPIEEYIGRDRFERYVDGDKTIDEENGLGVCPYVIARHERRIGDFFGRHAYEGSELAIHGINWGLSQLDEATARSINETVFMAGAGDEPDEVPLGRLTAIYVKLQAGVPAPEMQYIVPQLKIEEVRQAILGNVELLWTRQPQLILNALKLISGTSGETLARVLKPVEAEILRARRLYEDAVIRALQIGASVGVFTGLWDIGTGTGTKEAADRAFDGGQGPEAASFAERSAIPPTDFDRKNRIDADTWQRTKDLDDGAKLAKLGDRQAGLELAVGPEEAAVILQREATEGVIPTEPL
jgi:hypothetical protein